MKKKITIICFFVILLFSIIGLGWHVIKSSAPEEKSDIEAYFVQNRNEIDTITNYFINSEYSDIRVKKNVQKDGYMDVGYNKKIDDSAVADAITLLFKNGGFYNIGKVGNTIFFQKWGMFEKEYGLAYSIGGEETPTLLYLTKLEPLSEYDGWYYFEADYNEWRVQNQ